MVLVLILFSFFTSVSAQTDTEGCCKKKLDPNFAQNYLEWWAASSSNIKNAKCRNPGKPSNQEMLNYIEKNLEGTKASAKINGVELKDEDPRLIYLFEKLTSFVNPFYAEEEEKKHNKFKVPSGCEKAICALESILGKSISLKTLYLLDRYELNVSHVTHKDLSAWESGELDIILESVDDLPAHLVPFEKNKYLKHFKRGWGKGEDVIANSVIKVYSTWEQLPSNEERMSVMVHEIGHNIGDRLKQDESKEWLDMSGWVEKDGNWTATKKSKLASKYGGKNPAEDFAETFVAYRYNPTELKKISPEKYQHMKEKVFLGIEYTSEAKCLDKNSYVAKVKSELNVSDLPVPETYGACNTEINKIIYGEDVNLKVCIKRSLLREELEKKTKNMDPIKKDAIISAINFERIDVSDISDEEELEAYKKIVGDIYGSISKDYVKSGDDCSLIKEVGSLRLRPFNKLHFNNVTNFSLKHEVFNNHLHEICKSLKNPETISCKDLLPFMKEHLPERIYLEQLERKTPPIYRRAVVDKTKVQQRDFSRLVKSEKKPPFKTKKGFRCDFP